MSEKLLKVIKLYILTKTFFLLSSIFFLDIIVRKVKKRIIHLFFDFLFLYDLIDQQQIRKVYRSLDHISIYILINIICFLLTIH